MTILIICIDRDNDIGVKANIRSPVIGREANLKAAISLGLVDPEDSDTNAIFGAVKLYEKLRASGEDVEVVTFAGDKDVGVVSDRKIMEQVHQVVRETKAKEAILVTDGAEDERLMSLVQTRIDVIAMERITVKQEPKIEGMYYYIQKAIEDEKMRRIVLPLALILMAWGISLFLGLEGVMRGFIVFLIGAYLLVKTYHLEGDVNKAFTNISEQVKEGKFSWVFATFSIIIFVLGLLRSIDNLTTGQYYEEGISMYDIKFFIYIIIIMNDLVVWSILALLIREWGKFFDSVIASGEEETPIRKKYWSHLNISVFLIATGLLFKAGLNIVLSVADSKEFQILYEDTIGMIILAIALFLGGRQIYGGKGTETDSYGEKERRHLLSLKRKDKISGWRH